MIKLILGFVTFGARFLLMIVLTFLNLNPSLWWRSGHFTAAFQPVLKSGYVSLSGGRDQGSENKNLNGDYADLYVAVSLLEGSPTEGLGLLCSHMQINTRSAMQ